jgi:hypothetical protein
MDKTLHMKYLQRPSQVATLIVIRCNKKYITSLTSVSLLKPKKSQGQHILEANQRANYVACLVSHNYLEPQVADCKLKCFAVLLF